MPLPEKRRGPALLVLHAGEPLPSLPVPLESLDLRQASPDLAAAYAIFRRYLFDYRADLATPLWLLLDGESRVRKIYAEPPDAATIASGTALAQWTLAGLARASSWRLFHRPARTRLLQIWRRAAAGRYGDRALPYFEEMLRRTPDDPKTLLAVGRIHLEAKRLPQAREALGRAVSLDAHLPDAWNELGGVESEAGNFTEAMRCYQRALDLAPDLGYVLVNAAHAQENLGRAAEAERLYRRALAADAKNDRRRQRAGPADGETGPQ